MHNILDSVIAAHNIGGAVIISFISGAVARLLNDGLIANLSINIFCIQCSGSSHWGYNVWRSIIHRQSDRVSFNDDLLTYLNILKLIDTLIPYTT